MNTEHKKHTEEPEESGKPANDKATAEEAEQELDPVELLKKAREQQRQQQQQ